MFTVGRRVLVVSSGFVIGGGNCGRGREKRRKGEKVKGWGRGSDVECNGSRNDFDAKNARSRGLKTKKTTTNSKIYNSE